MIRPIPIPYSINIPKPRRPLLPLPHFPLLPQLLPHHLQPLLLYQFLYFLLNPYFPHHSFFTLFNNILMVRSLYDERLFYTFLVYQS